MDEEIGGSEKRTKKRWRRWSVDLNGAQKNLRNSLVLARAKDWIQLDECNKSQSEAGLFKQAEREKKIR